jgi:cell division septal protein FtsQ
VRFPCAREIDIDTSKVDSPQQPSEKFQSPQLRRSAVVLMVIVVAALTLVAIFANIQRLHRSQIETIVVVPASSTTQQPR